MKIYTLSLALGLLLLAGACKKSGSGDNKPNNPAYASSIRTSSSQSQIVDSFTYDAAHRLVIFAQYDLDTTSGTPLQASLIATFAYANSSQTPYAYTFEQQTPAGSASAYHQLFYDGGYRIIKDSSLDGSGFVTYFSYPGNNIASRVVFGNPDDHQIDTQFVNNGNITAERIYYPNDAGTADSLEASLQFGYSSLINPAYHAVTASSIGPLLHILTYDGFGGYSDYISANALSKLSGLGLPSGQYISFAWTADSKGRAGKAAVSLPGQAAGALISCNYY
jgi:hypothetical protein